MFLHASSSSVATFQSTCEGTSGGTSEGTCEGSYTGKMRMFSQSYCDFLVAQSFQVMFDVCVPRAVPWAGFATKLYPLGSWGYRVDPYGLEINCLKHVFESHCCQLVS